MKKVKRLLALGAAALMLTSAFAMPASAATPNTELTTWGVNVAPDQWSATSTLRPKYTTSGCYVKYIGGDKPFFSCDVLNANNVSQCTKTGSIAKGKQGRIAQYVVENGYSDCKLKFTSPNGSYGGGNGEWSPDTYSDAPYINA